MVQLPVARAEDDCFVTTPYQENIWSDPYYSDAYYARVGSVCEIKLYDLDVSFADIDGVEGLISVHSDNNDALTNVEEFNRGLRMRWSGSEDEQEGVDYVEFSPEESGDDLFGYWYMVPSPNLNRPAAFKRNMPITINSAHYEVNGEMREVKNLVLNSVLTIAPDHSKETLMISGVEKQDVTYTGQPVVLDGELTVEENDDGITAEDLTEQYYIYDDYDLSFTPIERPTDLGEFYLVEYNFENDNYRASLRVPFTIIRPHYLVTEGDEGEHAIGSGEDLAFVIDKDPASYTDRIVTIAVDGEYIDVTDDSITAVKPGEKTVTLFSEYLDTLELGKHSIEIYFFDTSVAGVASATFTITEEVVIPKVPNTGVVADEITVTYPYYGFVEDAENPWATVYDALDETGEVQYSDAFFNEPSAGDHPKLRAVSYALALAGYENQADGYPVEAGAKNPKLYNLLDQMGFSDYQSWDESSEADGHSFGTTIGRKTLANGQELIVIAPRNYNYLTEWLSNFNVGTTGDHAGFAESAELVVERFNQYVADRGLSDYKVWVVGYSRGGAVIDLFGKTINEHIADYDLAAEDFYVYTFGAPRASVTETEFDNIHDVKDGNDLLLGYVFPEAWGFYNTGVYEEIHPADLSITTSVVDISDLADSSKAMNLLSSNAALTKEVGTMNGREFMDEWMAFVTSNGLTRGYFDAEVKVPLSAIMKLYQQRTLDKQSEFTSFLTDTSDGLAGRVAGNAFQDLLTGGYGMSMEEALDNFPPYQDLVKVMKGTATGADVDELLTYLTNYMGVYSDYSAPTVTETEFAVIKENLPKLVKALAPILVADAKYTQETFGEDYSLFYTYSLAANAEKLVVGHIPESIMPILKSLIPEEEIVIPKVPNTGRR
ncbi:hypothetical protein IKE71_03260 [Candidatus Saccharibacteria bacterium]|nr:hypothetical protein [Candidatus Saccharibacteria bacterium]